MNQDEPARTDRLHLLGIRHHGPGSARGVVSALSAIDPAVVLIEGPSDADEMIPFAASAAMVPPVALLVHANDDPANASFYPFAVFSPEWQAMRWALHKARPVRFIDLPAAIRLAERAQLAAQDAGQQSPNTDDDTHDDADDGANDGAQHPAEPDSKSPDPEGLASEEPASPHDDELAHIRHDPLSYLAEIAGYEDGETWWNALVEQGSHGPEIFSVLEDAITALRDRLDPLAHASPAEAKLELQREAHMRLAIAKALSETDGKVAVICGAWHVPALRKGVASKDDRALLSGLAKTKVTATWVPWTETRLAAASGYGAGVISPGWYAHLWEQLQHPDSQTRSLSVDMFASRWQARVANLLRHNGRPASTASVIEASRLAVCLAGLRDLALPGLDEMREASLATLCEGETAPFRLIEQQLVIGRRVGEIDEAVPQMPLAADLARQQRKLKLKPEALDTDISLDLRSDAGLAKSLLLHRLTLINVPWGAAQGSGSSRGTFRENWRLRWDPEFSVRLAEALVYGATIEQAAGNCAIAKAGDAKSLPEISELVRGCLDAGLEQAANAAIAILQRQAAATSDIAALAGAIPPLVSILRYGTAREMPTLALRLLVTSLTQAVCAGLVYASRSLQAEAAQDMRNRLAALDSAMGLIEDEGLTEAWRRALGLVCNDTASHPLLGGFAVRALYEQGELASEPAALHLSRALSPGASPQAAGDWLDGFLGKSGQILLHDAVLRAIIDGWLCTRAEVEFINLLPMLRRGFSGFDLSERRRLLDEIAKMPDWSRSRDGAPAQPAMAPTTNVATASLAPGFREALPLLLRILGAAPDKAPATTGDNP